MRVGGPDVENFGRIIPEADILLCSLLMLYCA